MGGPRITTGEDSKQDYSTPGDFLEAVTYQFGPIVFDLAAHKLNHKHERYFAPKNFVEKYDPDKKLDVEALIASLVRRGAVEIEARPLVTKVVDAKKKSEIIVPNHDEGAYALDAFAHSWASLSDSLRSPKDGGPGLLWLNCEFSDIEPWALKFKQESKLGANGLLLTPAAVGSNWFRNLIAGTADVYILNGRLCFDGKNVFPKDCILSHFHPKAKGDIHIWEWKKNMFWTSWNLHV